MIEFGIPKRFFFCGGSSSIFYAAIKINKPIPTKDSMRRNTYLASKYDKTRK